MFLCSASDGDLAAPFSSLDSPSAPYPVGIPVLASLDGSSPVAPGPVNRGYLSLISNRRVIRSTKMIAIIPNMNFAHSPT